MWGDIASWFDNRYNIIFLQILKQVSKNHVRIEKRIRVDGN